MLGLRKTGFGGCVLGSKSFGPLASVHRRFGQRSVRGKCLQKGFDLASLIMSSGFVFAIDGYKLRRATSMSKG